MSCYHFHPILLDYKNFNIYRVNRHAVNKFSHFVDENDEQNTMRNFLSDSHQFISMFALELFNYVWNPTTGFPQSSHSRHSNNSS